MSSLFFLCGSPRKYGVIIRLPILGGIKQCKLMVILMGFPLKSALFGLVI